MAGAREPWLSHGESAAAPTDDAGAVLRAWRERSRQTQAAVAALLKTSQQHLSQIEKGLRPLSIDQCWSAGPARPEPTRCVSSAGGRGAPAGVTEGLPTQRTHARDQRTAGAA